MARRKTAAERRDLTDKVAFMSARSIPNRQIAERLGISRNTVAAYLKDALEERDPGPDAARAESIEHARHVKTAIWQRINASGKVLADGAMVPLMPPGLLAGMLNTSLAAQDRIDRLRGATPPERVQHEHEYKTLSDIAREAEGKTREQRIRLVG